MIAMMTTIREYLPRVELPFQLRLAFHFSRLGFETVSSASTVTLPLLLGSAFLLAAPCANAQRKERKKRLG